jgi:hypothetical protein
MVGVSDESGKTVANTNASLVRDEAKPRLGGGNYKTRLTRQNQD